MKRLSGIMFLALVLTLATSGCTTRKVMQECQQINDTELFLCKNQWKVWN